MESILEPIDLQNYQPVRQEAYNALREAILTGRLEPGTRLVERKIAKQLGVSRTPVREAIRKLELEGLVEHLPRRGVVVARMSVREAWEVYSIRAVLEGLAARLAAERINPMQLKKLNELVSAMEKACDEEDYVKLQELHLEFNSIICKAAESPRLHQMIDNLVDYIVGFTKIGYSVPGRTRAATREHRELLEALMNGDGEKAEKIARQHIENSRQAYFMQLALRDQKNTNI
ncbi:GntR family transcriptional regulator [Neomoorella humiferrea]|uniref:Putative HTH-type transcriptional regulator YdfH n=1 Tax=Neomoorella humiferrea TaxID=676965 RepID=A0A2T0ATK3_9FIRM|nr:GntR family transcriptional regulator [Moorella humiferrea]PRR73617.1 putative HTH-type transcriptional regulator YdfH [Moorella humiferrea]